MSAFSIVVYSLCAIYMVMNFKYDIQMLQQNSYRISRYWKWLRGNIGSNWRLADVAMLLLLWSVLLDVRLSMLIIAAVCLTKVWILLRRKYKKPLAFTKRVWRIYTVSAVISLGAFVAVAAACGSSPDIWGLYPAPVITLGTLLVITTFSWAIVILAVAILTPVEKSINRKYWNEADRILRSMPDLTVVGITGSYGKTSTKHYLERILSESFDVLMTPGSYNTTMGVIRTVREMMKPFNQIFICEMGAKQKGDIKEICDLVHPQIGIVTAVGPMHLESFKSIENVQATKFELVDSLPSDGLAVVNNDFEYCANREVTNVETLRYGVETEKGCAYHASDVTYTPQGTTFIVNGPGGLRLPLATHLLGECNISDLLAAVAVALRLGVPHDKIQYAVRSIQQVEHRLSIAHTPGGVTIIDDAFNSNPAGSRMAVDVLSHFKDGKRIIVTPGMIELGSEQYSLNEKFGEYIGKWADMAIVVGEYNRDAIVAGIRKSGFPEDNLYPVASFTEAQKLLSTLLATGDTVLYENDLPDTFK